VSDIPFLATSRRRRARERALELLYEAEMKSVKLDLLLSDQVIAPDDYTVELVKAVAENLDLIDAKITAHSRTWNIERLAVVDRQLLRIALCEIYFIEEVPDAVAIDEAVELAKEFSTEDSPKYINGILGAALTEKNTCRDPGP